MSKIYYLMGKSSSGKDTIYKQLKEQLPELKTSTVLASISLGIFSPIDSENRLLDMEEKRIYQRTIIYCLIIFGFLNIVLFLLKAYTYIVSLSIGIQLSAALQIPYILKRLQKMTKNER